MSFFVLTPIIGLILFYAFYYSSINEEEEITLSQKAIIQLIAQTMKADGQLTKSELNVVKEYLLANYNENVSKKLLLYLRTVLKRNLEIQDIRPLCLRINQTVNYKGKLSVLSVLFKIAYAQGEITQKEFEIIQLFARFSCIRHEDFRAISQLYINNGNYRKRRTQEQNNYKYQRTTTQQSYNSKKWAYDELGIPENSSPDEIKKAFRKLAQKYHPDKLNNASEREVKYATEKFRKVINAYEALIEDK